MSPIDEDISCIAPRFGITQYERRRRAVGHFDRPGQLFLSPVSFAACGFTNHNLSASGVLAD
jgi:hypothetical protein